MFPRLFSMMGLLQQPLYFMFLAYVLILKYIIVMYFLLVFSINIKNGGISYCNPPFFRLIKISYYNFLITENYVLYHKCYLSLVHRPYC